MLTSLGVLNDKKQEIGLILSCIQDVSKVPSTFEILTFGREEIEKRASGKYLHG